MRTPIRNLDEPDLQRGPLGILEFALSQSGFTEIPEDLPEITLELHLPRFMWEGWMSDGKLPWTRSRLKPEHPLRVYSLGSLEILDNGVHLGLLHCWVSVNPKYELTFEKDES